MEDPGNQKWVEDGKAFVHELEEANAIVSEGNKELVRLLGPDGKEKEKEGYINTGHYIELGSFWVKYDSNRAIKVEGSEDEYNALQPQQEEAKYRVYLNVEGAEVIQTFKELIETLNGDPDLQKFGFRAKTANISRAGQKDVGALMGQRDRIVL